MRFARSVVERLVLALLRLAATCMTIAAPALIVPAAALWVMDAEMARLAGVASIQLAVVFAFAGGTALYLVRARTRWLPDGQHSSASAGSGLDGWMILFPLTLVGLPLLIFSQLQPLAAFWRDVLMLADQLDLWQGLQGDTGASGLVLMPVIAALAVPAVELIAAATQTIASVLLILLLLLRSSRVPRALLLCVLIQGGLVGSSLLGAMAVERLAPSVEQLIRETPDGAGTEQTRALDELQRYRAVTRGASQALTAAWVLLAAWAPLLLFNDRARTTFAPVDAPNAEARLGALPHIDPAQVSAMTDRARAQAYVDAAKHVDEATPPSRWF
jgi:hypothetical protein